MARDDWRLRIELGKAETGGLLGRLGLWSSDRTTGVLREAVASGSELVVRWVPDLDERRLLVELQSLGVRVEDESAQAHLADRRGGAGPSDAAFLWVRGLPLTVPVHSRFARNSPYTLKIRPRMRSRSTHRSWRSSAPGGPVPRPGSGRNGRFCADCPVWPACRS